MKMMRYFRKPAIWAIVCVLACGSIQSICEAAEALRYRVSYGGTAGYQLPLWVNRELGFGKKQGVDLEIIMIAAGTPNIQAILGGSLQLTQTAASSALLAAVQNAPLAIVATLENRLPLQIISRPEIKEPQQLRGKVIGINRFGGSNDAAIYMALKAWKIDPKEITMLPTGGTSARMAALMNKRVDATVQSYPEIYQARKLGMNVLADVADYGYFTNTSNIVTRAELQQNRGAIKAFPQRHSLRRIAVPFLSFAVHEHSVRRQHRLRRPVLRAVPRLRMHPFDCRNHHS